MMISFSLQKLGKKSQIVYLITHVRSKFCEVLENHLATNILKVPELGACVILLPEGQE
jgi:hypothetical protein